MKNKLTKKKMNPEVYQLRCRVMKIIYEAKELVPQMPRITVRITDNHERTLALATIGRDYIEVSERAITCSEFDLRTIVYHELVHAVWGIRHIDNCPLMKPVHSPVSKEEAQALFLKYAKNPILRVRTPVNPKIRLVA